MTFIEKLSAKYLQAKKHIGDVVRLSLPYFQSEERWRARLLLGASVVLNLGIVYFMVLFNQWNKVFYDALENKNEAVFWKQLGVFAALAFGYILIAVYKFYLTQSLELRWRTWMTQSLMAKWLSANAFHRIESQSNGSDNPDQRLQEDVTQFTAETISLTLGFLEASLTLGSFVGILWGLSGITTFTVGGTTFAMSGFMVWMALAYAATGSYIAHWLAKSLAGLNAKNQMLEANFRHHLVRVRDASESIAFERGSVAETSSLTRRFAQVVDNLWITLKVQKRFTWFSAGYNQASVVFPFLVAAPKFFSGAIKLGDLIQTSSAFGRVEGALSWFIGNYMRLASWQATTLRLTSLVGRIEELTEHPPSFIPVSGTSIAIDGIDIHRPDGSALLSGIKAQARSGDIVLLSGPSGCGKTSLFRMMAGIWPHFHGDASLSRIPEGIVYLPQRPYVPEGKLRDAICYPQHPDAVSDDALQAVLNTVDLPELFHRIDEQAPWSKILSGGEMQRLAAARALLQKPSWIFADEATSALDEERSNQIMKALAQAALSGGGGMIFISHRVGGIGIENKTWRISPTTTTEMPDHRLSVE